MSKSILDFFSKKRSDAHLPDPRGPLSSKILPSTIASANTEVLRVMNGRCPSKLKSAGGKRGGYNKYSPEFKAKVASYAIENGNCRAARKFSSTDKVIDESSVRGWVTTYKKEVERKRKAGEEESISLLPVAKRGRPLLLGDTLDTEVKSYIRSVREGGGLITTEITMAAARAIVRKYNPGLLTDESTGEEGPITITSNWAKSLLYRMKFVKRRGSTTTKYLVGDFESIKCQFLADIVMVKTLLEIPDDLILNWDHTGINIVPGSSWTMDQKGQQHVELLALDDKRQITAVVCGSLTGNLLPFQLIYQGKTAACLPKVTLPQDWHVTCTSNHWSNEQKTLEYIELVLLPYLNKTRKELGLPESFPAMVLFDAFKGQTTDSTYQLLEQNNISVVHIPANCTNKLQPMDLSVNKSLKEFLKNQFGNWYSQMVFKDLKESRRVPVDLRLSVMKPLNAMWLKEAHKYLKSNPSIIKNGFKASGITDALEKLSL